MNERIDNLMVNAGAYFGGEGVDYSNFDPKKFAELVVRECADLFDKNETEYAIPEHRIHDSIMIHFGLY